MSSEKWANKWRTSNPEQHLLSTGQAMVSGHSPALHKSTVMRPHTCLQYTNPLLAMFGPFLNQYNEYLKKLNSSIFISRLSFSKAACDFFLTLSLCLADYIPLVFITSNWSDLSYLLTIPMTVEFSDVFIIFICELIIIQNLFSPWRLHEVRGLQT